MSQARGSIWANKSKKKGYAQSVGSYGYSKANDRFFKLTTIKTEKTRVYESPDAAQADGWFIVKHGK
jgi:hypothetical protein